MTDKQQAKATKALVDAVVEGIQEKKGKNITVLDMTGIENTITSYFVICDGDSNVHVDTIADSVEDYVRKKLDDKPLHIEGKAMPSGCWSIIWMWWCTFFSDR